MVEVPVAFRERAAEAQREPARVEPARRPMVLGAEHDRQDERGGRRQARPCERRSRDHHMCRRPDTRREPPLVEERQPRGDGDRHPDECRAQAGERESRDVGQVVGGVDRRDADLPLLEVLDKRIVIVARVHEVGWRDPVELSPGDLLHADAEVGAAEVDVGEGLDYLGRRRAVLIDVRPVVDARTGSALERSAGALAQLEVPT